MAVDKSRSPYFDDYNEQKHFHEMLFVPSRAVQVRELNQMQTMFQRQISRFGDHVFEEGSVVIPGETNYDLDLSYVAVTIDNYSDIVSQLVANQISLESSNGITAKVKLIVAPDDGDPLTFYLEYLNASSDGETSKFQTGETLDVINNQDEVIAEASVTDVGVASKFTINQGVYYLGGRFVLVEEETVLLDKYGNTPSSVVCIEYAERIVTENQDTSLFDNAQGAPNFTAPGAHRLAIDTGLVVYDLDDLDTIPEDNVEIFRIENGELQRKISGPSYSQIGNVLAQRTYEESGNYTVKSFKVNFREHTEVFTDDPDEDKFVAGLEAGLAYVKGFRIQNQSTKNVVIDKARRTNTINNSSISGALGYYIEVENMNIVPSTSTLQEVSFYDDTISSPGVAPSGSPLGTARVRFIRSDGSNYRLYLFDVRNDQGQRSTGFISNALSVHSSVGEPFSADLVDSELKDAANNSLVFPLNVEFVKSLNDEFGNSDTSFSSVRQINAVTDSNGQVTVSAAANEVFVDQDPTYAFASWIDTGELVSTNDKYSLGGSPTGSVITFDFGSSEAGREIRINAQIAKQEVQQKTKTTQSTSISGSLDGDGRLYLEKADAFELVSVTDDNGSDVTSSFTLVENKTKSYYGVSYVTGPTTAAYPVTVEFRYFSHSSGDYFGVDSYVDVDYDDIPEEDGVRLSDVLDFRPRINDAGTDFTGSGSVVGNIPTPYTTVRADVEHYLPRIDKLYVSADGEFGVVQGVPSLNPKKPDDPDDAMVLYILEVPPYTFSVEDVQADKINNRRYTMRDIGDLEQRISNVEYYVSLNNLEQEADAQQIIDPDTGLNRFKNGFLTDAFVDHSVGDFAWPLYHISVSDEGELRPEFSLNAIDLEANESESSNVVIKDGLAMLPYTEKNFIRQNLRSDTINVNPYAVYRWSGDLNLTPSVDSWIDTQYTDPDVTYRVFNNGRLTQTWNSWQLNWSGGTSRTSSSRTTNRRTFFANTRTTTTTTRTTRTNIDIVNDRVVDTSVIPFMRSINVRIEGEGHRPRARLHFFFDDTNINQWVRPDGGSFGQAVRANDDGDFTAIFRIPNNSTQRFRTGEKQIIVTDEPNNVREESTSYGETTFSSTGVRNTRQRTIVATRNINTATTTRTTRIRRNTWSGDGGGDGGGAGADPLAQSFLVEREGGVFITKVNCFFSTKDDSVPVKVQIREMENGWPTLNVVPGGEKTLHPRDVNLSSDGSVATSFEFPHPVYLLEDEEYCFVLMSNSNNYRVHIATMGQRDKGTDKFIISQPYVGVMFKSQNNTTWTEDQESDLQFQLFSAEFDTSVVGNLVLENTDLDAIQLPTNSVETVSGSSEVIIKRERHNYIEGGVIEISGATGGNGIDASDLNGQHTIIDILDPSEIVIDVGTEATESGFIGGDELFISDTIQAMLLNPNITDIQLPNTGIVYEVRGSTGQSIDGTETPYQVESDYFDVTNQEINDLSVPWVITNRLDEAENLNDNRSFKMRASLASTNSNISPVVDLQGANVITPFAMITYPQTEELDGSNNYANYRTRITSLRNPATSIRAYLDIDYGEGSDVILSCRMGNSEEEVEEAQWQKITRVTSEINRASGESQEYEFALENVDSYTSYQVMIQLKSQSAVNYPICKRLRVLALGT